MFQVSSFMFQDNIMKNLYRVLPTALMAMPLLAAAQVTTFQGLITRLTSLINMVVPFLLTIVVALIIWGGVGLATAGGDAEKREAAKDRIMYGLIGAVVIVGVWGLISIAESVLGLGTTPGVTVPSF